MSDIDAPCVHCGLCLNACATYRALGNEAASPRGRLYIMKAMREGTLADDDAALEHLDSCLGCLACETACPSGVRFGLHIEEHRVRVYEGKKTSRWKRLLQRSGRSRPLLVAGMIAASVIDGLGLARLRRRLPALGLLPRRLPTRKRPTMISSGKATRMRVALLRGCVAETLRPEISTAAVEVLVRHGFEVRNLPLPTCCGALSLHTGDRERARREAETCIAAFEATGADVLVVTAAGCGAMIKSYDRLLTASPTAHRAHTVAARCSDICELLVRNGPTPPARPLEVDAPVAYHDACHLLHAQGIRDEPRAVVAIATGRIPVDLGDNTVCCGSAGSYNVEHPKLGHELGRAKGDLVRSVSPPLVAVANIGCILQLERALALGGHDTPVRHPIELLAAAYRGEER
jgi:glycolate oxidase iron-sulfur subunit